jgi:hypothetical protein
MGVLRLMVKRGLEIRYASDEGEKGPSILLTW